MTADPLAWGGRPGQASPQLGDAGQVYVAAFYGSVLLVGVLLFNARASEGVGPDSVVGWAVGTLCALYLMYLFIICCFRRGIDGPNKYGPDPLEESPAIWV